MIRFPAPVADFAARTLTRSLTSSVRHCAVALLALLSIIAALHVSAASRVEGEPARAGAMGTKSALDNSFMASFDARVPTVNFFAINPDRVEQAKAANVAKFRKALQIGITQRTTDEAFDTPTLTLQWQPTASGGLVAHFKARTPGAIASRVAIQTSGLPTGSELRFAGSDAPFTVIHTASFNEIAASLDEAGRYWTPMTDGDTQLIEVFMPTGGETSGVRVSVEAISHIFASVSDRFMSAKATKAQGTCYINPVCTAQSPGFINAKNSVANMVFQSGAGSYVCTGNLLNDSVPSTQIPYFISSAHCISTQAEANTLVTYWNYENPTCQAPNISLNDAVVTAVQGGATLLYAPLSSDVLLLQLRGTVPATAYFAGWDSAMIGGGSAISVVHHPGGDPRKVSAGQTLASPFSIVSQDQISGSFITVAYTSSSTEGGSSGGGLFTTISDSYFLRGALCCGDALCNNSGSVNNLANRDYFSRLDLAFPQLKQWLDPVATSLGPLSRRGGIDIDGNNKSVLLVASTSGTMQAGRLQSNNTFTWTAQAHPGQNYRLLGAVDFLGSGRSDMAGFEVATLNALGQGDVRIYSNFSLAGSGQFLRAVKPAWDVQVVGDLDGDGFGDLVWRFLGQSPNIDDQGVSYIWFTSGGAYQQLRKRGGAPLTWKLLGAADFDGINGTDMVYVSPENNIRVLMATPGRTCANLSGGTITAGSTAIKLADFTGNRRGDILARNASTGAIQIIVLNGAGLNLPDYAGVADDPNASCTASSLSVTQTATYTFSSDPTLTILATGDFNGGGIFDILFMRPDRTLVLWLMNANGAAPTVVNAGTAPAGMTAFPLQ